MFGIEEPFGDDLESWQRYESQLARAVVHSPYFASEVERAQKVIAWLEDPQGADPRLPTAADLKLIKGTVPADFSDRIKRALQADKD